MTSGAPPRDRRRGRALPALLLLLAVTAAVVAVVLAVLTTRPSKHHHAQRSTSPATAPNTAGGTTPGSSSGPTAPGRTALPTGTAALALCAAVDSGFGVAQTYIGLAETGEVDAAQACVRPGSVPVTVTGRLRGTVFGPVTTDQHATVIEFRGFNAPTRVTVTTVQEADGRYEVTAVRIS